MNQSFSSQNNLLINKTSQNNLQIDIIQTKQEICQPPNNFEICQFCKKKLSKIEQQNYENDKCKTQLQDQSDLENDSFYYSLVLINQKVNLRHLKVFIQKYQKYLRQIIVQHCQFYLNDSDLLNSQNEVGSLRMLSEIDFVHMFEMFHFQDISIIELDMCKLNLLKGTTYSVDQNETQKHSKKDSSVSNEDKNQKVIKKQISSKIAPKKNNSKSYSQNDILKTLKENKIKESKEEFQKEFDCEEECEMIKYEFEEKNKISNFITDKKSYDEEMMRKLKWGDLLDQDKFGEILLDSQISDIKIHLETYKTYTKHSYNQGILIILGDVFKNQLSLNQLLNLIKINLQDIVCVIFKGNRTIPYQIFSQLMKYFLQIPNLKTIGFIASVLMELSFNEFLFLIKKNKIDKIVLYKSYFLKDEINQLIKLKDKDFILNHQSYFILDLHFNLVYEFTPFSFIVEDLQKKQPNDLLQVEQIYLQQQEYPKDIQSWVSFFQGKKLIILHNNQSFKLLQKLTDIDDQNQYQNEITDLLEKLMLTDDMHYINLQMLMYYVDKYCDNETFPKDKFTEILSSLKSRKATIEVFSDFRLKEIKNYRFWQFSTYSFLSGFTRIKSNNYSFILQSSKENPILGIHPSLKKNKQLTTDNIKKQLNINYLQEISQFQFQGNLNNQTFVKISHLNDIRENINNEIKFFLQSKNIQKMEFELYKDDCYEIEKQLQFQVASKTIQKLKFVGGKLNVKQNGLIKYILPKCTNLLTLKFQQTQFNFEEFNDSDKNFLKTIQQLNFEKCKFINVKFLNNFLKQTTKLKKLIILSEVEISINIQNIPKSMELLKLETPNFEINNLDFYIFVLNNLLNLKEINLYHIKDEINIQKLEEYKFNFNSLEKINSINADSNTFQLISWVIKYSPNIKSINFQKDSNLKEEEFMKLDHENIQNLEINYQNQSLKIILKSLKNIQTLKLFKVKFLASLMINSMSQKLTKLQVWRCEFESIQFFELILQECNNLRYLKIEECLLEINTNEKFDFSKMKILDLQKFKLISSKGFTKLDFPQQILKRFQTTLKIIKVISEESDDDVLEYSNFISIFAVNNKLEELNINSSKFTYNELVQMMEKKSSFFNIMDFNLKYYWDNETIKNKEINFFKVFDYQNLTIFQQMNKSNEQKIAENQQQIKNEEQNNEENINNVVNKYSKYPPINFHTTFKISNNINNQIEPFNEQNVDFNQENQIYTFSLYDMFQYLKVLEMKDINNVNNQHLINLISNYKNLTDIILVKVNTQQNQSQLNLNEWQNTSNLKKLIIKKCKISHLIVNKLIQSQNLEELKINYIQDENVSFNSFSKKLKKLDFTRSNSFEKNQKEIFQQCQELELISFGYHFNLLRQDNMPQNLLFFFFSSYNEDSYGINGRQVNQIFQKCQQLKIFQIHSKIQDIEQINFDLLTKNLKKLSIISYQENFEKKLNFFMNYYFLNKIKSDWNIYEKELINLLLQDIQENQNYIYLELEYKLTSNDSFTRYIEQKYIIGLLLQQFDYDQQQKFFNNYSKQFLNLKHLIFFKCDFNYVIYQDDNLNLQNHIESLLLDDFCLKTYFLDDLKKININLFRNLKSLGLNLNIDPALSSQILKNCILLEYLYLNRTELNYSEDEIPKQIQCIVLQDIDQSVISLICSQKDNCNQLKQIVIKLDDIISRGVQTFKNLPKNLEIIKIKNFNNEQIQSLNESISERQQKLKRMVVCNFNLDQLEKIIELIDQVQEVDTLSTINIYYQQQQRYIDFIKFPQISQLIQGILILFQFYLIQYEKFNIFYQLSIQLNQQYSFSYIRRLFIKDQKMKQNKNFR